MLPLLLPLVSAVVPGMAKWLFPSNPKVAEATQAVASVVQTVTGGDASSAEGMAAIGATLARQPELGIDLQIKLSELHASLQAEADQAAAVTLAARLADVANARAQTLALAQAHSLVAWVPAIVTVVAMLGYYLMLWLVIAGDTKSVDPDMKDILKISFGTLGGGFIAGVSYWLGSSQGSRDKSATIARQSDQLAVSTPPIAS